MKIKKKKTWTPFECSNWSFSSSTLTLSENFNECITCAHDRWIWNIDIFSLPALFKLLSIFFLSPFSHLQWEIAHTGIVVVKNSRHSVSFFFLFQFLKEFLTWSNFILWTISQYFINNKNNNNELYVDAKVKILWED